MTRVYVAHRWMLLEAACRRMPATRAEHAAESVGKDRWRRSLNRFESHVRIEVDRRHRAHESLRIRMGGPGEDFGSAPSLDDASAVHDGYAVAHARHHL